MKKRILITALVILLAVFTFVSCSNEVTPEDMLGSITFGDDGSKALKTDVAYSAEVENLYWYYTAAKNDYGYTSGKKETYTPVATDSNGVATTGLQQKTLEGFSYGYWIIELRGFTSKLEAFDSSSTTADAYNSAADKNAAYKATLTNLLINNTSNTAAAVIKVGDGAETSIVFGTISFSDTDFNITEDNKASYTLSVTDTKGTVSTANATVTVNGTEKSISYSGLTYTSNPGVDITDEHTMEFVLTQKLTPTTGGTSTDSTEIKAALYTLKFTVVKGTKTTVSGTLLKNDAKGDVSLEGVQNLSEITLSKVLNVTYNESTGTDQTTTKTVTANGDQKLTYQDMEVTVPNGAKIALAEDGSSLSSDKNTSDAQLAFYEKSDSTQTGLTIEAGDKPLSYELKLPTTSDNESLVTVKKYFGKGLTVQRIYHEETEIEKEESAAVPTDGKEGWYYDSEGGYLYLYVKHASEFNIIINTGAASIDGTKYSTLKDAIEAAQDGSTITLLDDVEVTEALEFSESITLDMAGKKITTSKDGSVTIARGKVLTVKNAAADFITGVKVNNGSGYDGDYYPTLEAAIKGATSGQTITLLDDIDLTSYAIDASEELAFAKGVILDMNNHTITSNKLGVVYQGESFTIKNGTFKSIHQGKGNDNKASYALFIGSGEGKRCSSLGVNETEKNWVCTLENVTCDGGVNVCSHKLVVKDSNISGTHYYALWSELSGSITVESGTITSAPSDEGNSVLNTDAEIIINGGSFESTVESVCMFKVNNTSGEITVNGGTFTTQKTLAESTKIKGTLSITGGTFNADPSQYVADGYLVRKNTEANTWTVKTGYDELYEYYVDKNSCEESVFPLFYNKENSGKKDTVMIDGLKDGGSKTQIAEWQDLWAYGDVTIKNFEFMNGVTISAGYYDDEITITFENCTFHGTDQTALFNAAKNRGVTDNNNTITNAPTFKHKGNSRNEMGLIVRVNTNTAVSDASKTVNVVISGCSFIGKNDSSAERKSAYDNYNTWYANNTSNLKGSYGIGLGSNEDNTYHLKSAVIDSCTFEGINGHAINVAKFTGSVEIKNNTFTSYGVNKQNIEKGADNPEDVAIRGVLDTGGTLTLSGNNYNSSHDNKKIEVDNWSGTIQ